jgi:hypothetical protein
MAGCLRDGFICLCIVSANADEGNDVTCADTVTKQSSRAISKAGDGLLLCKMSGANCLLMLGEDDS